MNTETMKQNDKDGSLKDLLILGASLISVGVVLGLVISSLI